MEIGAHPTDRRESAWRRLYTRAARDGFELLLRHLARRPGQPILLPGYVGWSPLEGSGVFDPIHATGTSFAFYPVDAGLAVDVPALTRLLAQSDAFAVVLVHYFGFPEPHTAAIAELCRARGVVLIEDCAHCLGARLGERVLGEVGDYSLASLHKVLACERGGFVQANAGRSLPDSVPAEVRIAPDDLAVFASTDLASVVARRRANYAHLSRRIAGIAGIRPVYQRLPDGAVPLNLPVFVDAMDRFELYKRMRAKDVGVVALYHTLIEPLHEEDFPTAFEVSRRILNLPIHQDLRPSQLDRVAEVLAAALEPRGRREAT